MDTVGIGQTAATHVSGSGLLCYYMVVSLCAYK